MKRAIEVIAKAQSILALSLVCVLRAFISAPSRGVSATAQSSHRDGHAEMRLVRGFGVASYTSGRRPGSRLQERDDGEHAPVGVRCDRQPELLEDARDVLLDAALGQEDPGGDR